MKNSKYSSSQLSHAGAVVQANVSAKALLNYQDPENGGKRIAQKQRLSIRRRWNETKLHTVHDQRKGAPGNNYEKVCLLAHTALILGPGQLRLTSPGLCPYFSLNLLVVFIVLLGPVSCVQKWKTIRIKTRVVSRRPRKTSTSLPIAKLSEPKETTGAAQPPTTRRARRASLALAPTFDTRADGAGRFEATRNIAMEDEREPPGDEVQSWRWTSRR